MPNDPTIRDVWSYYKRTLTFQVHTPVHFFCFKVDDFLQ